MIKEFENVRKWKSIRGIGHNAGADKFKAAISQYNRFMQEGNEILDALIVEDAHEFKDALGDTIVTLVNLAKIMDVELEDGLDQAFDVIELRKGVTTPVGDFVRYGKLSNEDKEWCDKMQGNPGNQYFERAQLEVLTSENFIK